MGEEGGVVKGVWTYSEVPLQGHRFVGWAWGVDSDSRDRRREDRDRQEVPCKVTTLSSTLVKTHHRLEERPDTRDTTSPIGQSKGRCRITDQHHGVGLPRTVSTQLTDPSELYFLIGGDVWRYPQVPRRSGEKEEEEGRGEVP